MKKLPDCSFPFVDSDRIITVVYHRVAIKCSNSATGVEIVKERFRRGFCCYTIFQMKSTKNLIIGIKIRAKNEPI